jgi:predicted permease
MLLPNLLTTFADNLLPIILLSGVGFLIGKLLSIDGRSLGRIVFYIFSPILVFDLLANTNLPLDKILTTMSYSLTISTAVGLLTLAIGLLMRLERPILMAVLLTAIFANTGNYGLPLVSFAFGQEALAYAGLYFVANSVLFNTLGVLIASLGHMSLREAGLGLLKVPTVYAVLLAVFLNHFHIQLSVPFARTVELAANGAIPLMLVMLGLELQRVHWSNSLRALSLSTFLRLIISPVLGLLLSLPFGLRGTARQGTVVETAMPTAVTTTVLALEYQLEPSLITAVVFISTILSPLTLTPLLAFLGR